MTINFENTYQTIEIHDIKRFEKNFNILLPEDYKTFLLKIMGENQVKEDLKLLIVLLKTR